MSRQIFEYFFDREDLEPFYSELPTTVSTSRPDLHRDDRESSDDVKTTTTSEHVEASEPANVPPDRALEEHETHTATNDQSTSDICSAAEPSAAEVVTENEPSAADSEASPSNPASTEAIEPNRTRVRRLLSVHALGQYVFCVRSAILSAEKGDQRDIDEPLPRLTFLPNFDRERIEEALSARITQLGFFVLYGVCLAVLIRMSLDQQNRWVFYPGVVAFIGLCFWSVDVLVCIVELVIRRRAALRAEAREPAPDITKTEPVNWWSMLKAGFEPINYDRPFQHPELPLEGCPWRVLQRESQRIPVIKSGSRKLGPRKGELYPKHEVRLVAYALLLESMGHIRVPYGLVFPVDSPHGLAFPITDELRDRTVRLLHEFAQKLAASQQGNIQPQLPNNRNRCTNCDFGKPVATTAKEIERAQKSGQQLVILQHAAGDLYRCECADRFGSAPPHGLTIKKDLRAIVN